MKTSAALALLLLVSLALPPLSPADDTELDSDAQIEQEIASEPPEIKVVCRKNKKAWREAYKEALRAHKREYIAFLQSHAVLKSKYNECLKAPPASGCVDESLSRTPPVAPNRSAYRKKCR